MLRFRCNWYPSGLSGDNSCISRSTCTSHPSTSAGLASNRHIIYCNCSSRATSSSCKHTGSPIAQLGCSNEHAGCPITFFTIYSCSPVSGLIDAPPSFILLPQASLLCSFLTLSGFPIFLHLSLILFDLYPTQLLLSELFCFFFLFLSLVFT